MGGVQLRKHMNYTTIDFLYFIYFEIPASLPNKIDLETVKEQNVIELIASSLPGKGYKILLLSEVESNKEKIGKLTTLASWKGKKLFTVLKENIAVGKRVAPFKFCIKAWIQVPKNKPFLK